MTDTRVTGGGEVLETDAHPEGVAQHIARVASRLFATQGYDATPVRAIVEAAGVTKPTLYYHFGSKEGLAQALVTVPLTRLCDSMTALLDSGQDPREVSVAMIETHFAFTREDPDRGRFVFALFFGPLGSSLSAELARFGDSLTECWERHARDMALAGLIPADRATDYAANLRGLMCIRTMDYLYRDAELGPELARRLVGDVLNGFGITEGGRE